MAKMTDLREAYEDLRSSMLDEVNAVDTGLVQPAMDAKKYIQPMKKIIKRRDDRKVRFVTFDVFEE